MGNVTEETTFHEPLEMKIRIDSLWPKDLVSKHLHESTLAKPDHSKGGLVGVLFLIEVAVLVVDFFGQWRHFLRCTTAVIDWDFLSHLIHEMFGTSCQYSER